MKVVPALGVMSLGVLQTWLIIITLVQGPLVH